MSKKTSKCHIKLFKPSRESFEMSVTETITHNYHISENENARPRKIPSNSSPLQKLWVSKDLLSI